MDVQNINGSATESKKLDLEKLLELSSAVNREIQTLRGKEVTLVVGKTGSGKSTLINYLLKNKLVKTIDEDTDEVLIELDRMAVAETVGTKCNDRQFAQIGHEFVSETLYPKGFETERDLLLCDTAGFGDNRSSANNAAAYLAVQMIIQSAALIKGIIVVISVDDFKNRAAGLNETLSLLKQLIMDNKNCMENFRNSVVFVFTHADASGGKVKSNKKILNLLKKAQVALEQQISGEPNNEKLEDSLALCNIILSTGIQVVVFDPLFEEHEGQFRDNSIGRDCILNFIEQSSGIAKEDISFRVERIFQRYSDTVCEIANSFLRSRRVIVDQESRIQQYDQKIEDTKREISQLIEVNSDLEKYGQKNTNIEKLKDEQKIVKGEITNLLDQISNNKAKHDDVSSAKDQLENDTTYTLVHTEDVYSENAVYGTVKKGVVHSKTFDYSQSYPIAKIDYVGGHYDFTEGTPEKFSAPSYNEDRTRCKIQYDGPSHEYGHAEFRVYSEKRFTPDTKCQIKRYEDELKNIEMERKELKSDLMKAREKESRLSQLIIDAMTQNIRDTKSLIEANEERIEAYKKELDQFSDVLAESKQKLELAKHTLIEKESQYQMLIQFNEIVPFEELTIKAFIYEYKHGSQFHASSSVTASVNNPPINPKKPEVPKKPTLLSKKSPLAA